MRIKVRTPKLSGLLLILFAIVLGTLAAEFSKDRIRADLLRSEAISSTPLTPWSANENGSIDTWSGFIRQDEQFELYYQLRDTVGGGVPNTVGIVLDKNVDFVKHDLYLDGKIDVQTLRFTVNDTTQQYDDIDGNGTIDCWTTYTDNERTVRVLLEDNNWVSVKDSSGNWVQGFRFDESKDQLRCVFDYESGYWMKVSDQQPILGVTLDSALTIPRIDSPPVSLSSIDRPIVLYFFSDMCVPCESELKRLQGYAKYDWKNRIDLTAVGWGLSIEAAETYKQQIGLDVPVAADSEKSIGARFDVTYVPYVIMIDLNRQVRFAGPLFLATEAASEFRYAVSSLIGSH